MTQQPENPQVEVLKTPAPERLAKPPIAGRGKPAQRKSPVSKSRNTPADYGAGADDYPIPPEDNAVAMEDAQLGTATQEAARTAFGGSGAVGVPKRNVAPSADTKPPTVDEWQDFIGRVVLRTVTEGYLTLMLRDCDLTDQELRYLELSKDDLKEMAAPMASFANKNKTLRKHGRTIVAAADSWESVVAIFIWMRRVQKVARRHRPEIQAAKQERTAMQRARGQQRVAHSRIAQSPVPATTPQQDGSVSTNGNSGPHAGLGESSIAAGDRPYKPRVPNPGFIDNGGSG